MLWLTAATVLVGVIALCWVVLVKRRPDVDPLGSVSTHWVTAHRVDDV
jgi:hypothetical protein